MGMKTIKSTHLLLIIGVIITGISLGSCNKSSQDQKAKKLPKELINNPATAGNASKTGELPVMAFETDEHDFGRLIQGETVSYGFKFKNTGGSDLIIASVSSSCGCTVTDYPKDPLAPGNSGVVTVTFKSEGKRGFQHKNVTVMANTQPNTKVLKISAEIRLPEEEK